MIYKKHYNLAPDPQGGVEVKLINIVMQKRIA